MRKLITYIFLLLALPAGLSGQVNVAGATAGVNGTFPTLELAFGAINGTPQTGNNIVITITASTIETNNAILQAGAWNSVNIYPTGSGYSISGNVTGPVIGLTGADNVTIDGRVNATGSTKDLTIVNTGTSTNSMAIRIRNAAQNNTVKYCKIKGSETNAARGVIYFIGTAGNGNTGNTIDNNDITNSGGFRPVHAIYSVGDVTGVNSGNTISNNNIYDFWSAAVSSYGIHLSAYSTDFTITGNSFYETTTFNPTGTFTYNAIRIDNTSGNNFVISGNYIGGQAALCGGSALALGTGSSQSLTFNPIYINAGTTTASSVQGNIISNINYRSSSTTSFIAINIIAGAVNIGTSSGNTIGASTGTGSITVTGTVTGTNVYGIDISTTGTVDCRNNIIGSVTVTNAAANATSFSGIFKDAVTGTTTISSNVIGSTSTSASINASSGSTADVQSVYGISNAGSGAITISGNTIANLTNSTSNTTAGTAGTINGIVSSNGTVTVSNNTIRDLTIANANTSATNTASVGGIVLTGNTLPKTVSGNTIYNLSNSYATFAGNVYGMYYSGSTGVNAVRENFIHSLTVAAGTTAASISGIRIAAGATTWSNNIISLAGNTRTTIYGIYENGVAGNNNNIYFNTVYIGGAPTAGTSNSYALYSAGTLNTRNFRNNIFVNARSNNGATGKHYAAYLSNIANLTIGKNDYYTSGSGGFLGYYIADISTIGAWVTATGQDPGSISANPAFASAGGTLAANYIPSNSSLLGAINTGITSDYPGTVRSTSRPAMGAYEITTSSRADIYKASVLEGGYADMRDAFYAINTAIHTGALEIRITAGFSEIATASLNASGTGGSNYTSVTVFPTVLGVTVSGNLATPLISLNGADNVTIDGRVNATGSTGDMIITNTSNSGVAGTSTIRFINDASSNTIKYCTLKGSPVEVSSGILLFTSATGVGNDGNIIDKNNITCSADADRPVNALFSAGTIGRENSGNIISNNNFYNFLNKGINSYGIYLSGSTTDWTISGNSFFETLSFAPTAVTSYIVIYINNISGNNFIISDNYIGGQAAFCGGSAWSKSNAQNNPFSAIHVNAGAITASSIQNNTIRNISWSNAGSATWSGINIQSGAVNIGTSTGNTIGASTGTGSVTVTAGANGASVYGIRILSDGTADCRKNIIGAVAAANSSSANATHVYGIYKSGAGTTTINNNTIGSITTAGSINAGSLSTGNEQWVYGIYNDGTAAVAVNSNIIANLVNSTTNTVMLTRGRINGVTSTAGTLTVSDNIIRDLSIANGNSVANATASVSGLALTGTAAGKTVSGNVIYNLSNTYASFTGSVIGISFAGSTGTNAVRENFIHSLSVNSSSTAATIYGIQIATGLTTWSNNIISLGGNSATAIYGISETGAAGNNNSIYFNTIYISGSLGSGVTNRSFALYSAVNTNIRNFRNNILVNQRSTTGGSNLHYALYIVSTGGTITGNYNDYYVTGTGGTLGYFGANKTVLPVVTGQDANSLTTNPAFTNPGSTTASDYQIGVALNGQDGTGIVTDYKLSSRGATPSMGALERNINKWKGTTSTAWNLAGNWTGNRIPPENATLVFDAAPVRNCNLNAAHSVTDIVNTQSSFRLVLNGFTLTIKGNIDNTGWALIDATTSNPALNFSGAAAQSIPPGSIMNNTAYNFILSNSAGVTLNTDLTVSNNLTINSGTSLNVSAAKTLTVAVNIINNAGTTGLVLKSDATGDGKLLNNVLSVPGTVELYLTGGTGTNGPRFHYFVPPVGTMTIGSSIADVKTNLGLTNFNGDLLLYDETKATTSKEKGWQYFDGWNSTTAFQTILASKGYNIYLTSADKITFSGTLNGVAPSFPLSFTVTNPYQGWNLAGNSYPCNYDLTGVTVLNNSDNVDNTVYYTKDGAFYYWNVFTNAGSSGYSDIIPPMQGFFVRVRSTGNTLSLPVAYKTASTGDARSKGASESKGEKGEFISKIKLVLSNSIKSDETIVCLIKDATDLYDSDYDAEKLFSTNNTVPYIYSVLNNIKYAINSVKGPENNPVIIPLTLVIRQQGTYTINISEFENLEETGVVLKHGAIETKLNQNTTYTFTSAAGTFTDFQLIFNNTTTGTETLPVKQEALRSWYSNEFLYINCSGEVAEVKGRLVVYDLQGKVVYNNPAIFLSPGITTQEILQLPKGLYITRIIAGNREFVRKIVVM